MSKVVLLVDDCADVRQVFKEMLEFCCDCTVIEACTGLEAVVAARARI